ncbi:MAG: hypothetical protein WC900_01770 [Oscillospiraceae bacterium]
MKKTLIVSSALCIALLAGCDSKTESSSETAQADLSESTFESVTTQAEIIESTAEIITTQPKPVALENGMPAPFGENAPDTGGDSLLLYMNTLCFELTGCLSYDFVDLVDNSAYKEYFAETSPLYSDSTSIRELFGMYSFIIHFNIPDETVRDILVKQRELYIRLNSSARYFTDEEIDLLLSRDDVKIAEYFIQPYAIAKDGNVYSPKWIYTHTIEDYEKAGFSADLISEKVEAFIEILPFTAEAKAALENKVTEYQQLESAVE